MWMPEGAIAQQRDTVRIQGHDFLLAETDESDEDVSKLVVNLVRIQQPASKWLLRHTLRETWSDCNSSAYELGAYSVSDSTFTFYTAWVHTSQALASVCGVRKQVYAVSQKGKVAEVSNVLWAYVHAGHPCLADLTTDQENWFRSNSSREERTDGKLFMHCMEQELGGRFVTGDEKEALVQECRTALKKQLAAVEKENAGLLELVKCF
jgi:hypothetical protein